MRFDFSNERSDSVSIFSRRISELCQHYSKYLEEVEEFLEKMRLKEEDDFKVQYSDMSSNPALEDAIERHYLYLDEQAFFGLDFFYKSSFISVYSFFESSLKELCASIQKDYKPSKNGNIEQPINCLKTNKLKSSFFSKGKKKMFKVKTDIRNCIAHQNGSLDSEEYDSIKNNGDFAKYIKKNEAGGFFVFSDSKLIYQFIDEIDAFYKSLSF